MNQTPKYEKIKQALSEQIRSGKLAPGAELPSETELLDTFQVSRITVRRAMDELYREGYIEKKQGKRAFVKHTPKTQELTTISSYTEEIIRLGMTPSRNVIRAELRLCTPEEGEQLSLDKADPVFYLERIVCANEQPFCYTQTTLPYYLFRDIETYDFSSSSLYSIIENVYKISISSSTLKLKAVSARREVAQYLDIDAGSPLLYTSAITYGRKNGTKLPIEMFQSYYLTDKFEYSLTQNR